MSNRKVPLAPRDLNSWQLCARRRKGPAEAGRLRQAMSRRAFGQRLNQRVKADQEKDRRMRRFRALEPQKKIPYYEIAPPKGCLSLKHWETVMTKSREARLQDAKKQRDSLRVETDQARVMIERLQAEVTELRRSADDMMMQSHARSEGAGGLSAPSPLSPTAKVSVSHSSPPTPPHLTFATCFPPGPRGAGPGC